MAYVMIQFEQSRVYDALMRLPIVAWSIALAIWSLMSLEQFIRQVNPAIPSAVYIINVAMRLSIIIYLIIISGSAFARMQAIAKAPGAEPRVSAVIGTFLITVLVLFPRRELSPSEGVFSALLILAGNSFAASVVVHLRRSFSIMPEARQIITSGPYRFVRHPLYLAEGLATVGALIQFFSAWTLGLVAVQFAFQLRRMHHEERILSTFSSAYPVYRNKISRILPGIY